MRWCALLAALALEACVPSGTGVAPLAVVTLPPNPAIAGIAIAADQSLTVVATLPSLSIFTNIQRTAGQLDRLSGPAPLTVFAATDNAFAGLAPGVPANLLAPENRPVLTRLAAYHLVSGRIDTAELRRQIAASGTATLTTLAGDVLTVTTDGPALVLTDANENRCYIEVADVRLTNGVLHTINGVLIPAL
ncbi:MAG TPA: fasciclin domain-containing protein [Sphingomonas sp.]